MAEERNDANFNRVLGDHLRHVRRQKGLSLLDVEALSDKEFKASVLGAYERGERAISAHRLARLALIYRLPVQAVLPPEASTEQAPGRAESVAVDVVMAEASEAPEAKAVLRYVRSLQALRGSWAERVVAIRSEDVRALAAVLERSPEAFVRRLEEIGVRAWRSAPEQPGTPGPQPVRREGESA